MIEMKVVGVALNPTTSMPIVILKEEDKRRSFLAGLKPEDFGKYTVKQYPKGKA